MVTVIEPGLSREIQEAIDNADVAAFKKLIEENDVDASSFLHAPSRKIAYPLINRALSRDLMNKDYAERLEIARILLEKGADPNMIAPNGLSAMAHLLHIHKFLGVRNRVDYEVYLFTMLFASELVIRYNADLNIGLRSRDTLLDDVIDEYERYYKKCISQMEQVTFEIIENMLERGARWTRKIDNTAFRELTALMLKYRDSQSEYKAPELPEPPFDALFDKETATKAWKVWNEKQSPAYEGLLAVRLLQYRASYHANWGFGKEESDAIKALAAGYSELEKGISKTALSALKKLAVPQKNLYDLKSKYEKELIDSGKEFLPMKPCYDDVYKTLYEACLRN